jgi:hypothetical protein
LPSHLFAFLNGVKTHLYQAWKHGSGSVVLLPKSRNFLKEFIRSCFDPCPTFWNNTSLNTTLLLLSSYPGNNGNTDTLTLRAFINALAFDVVLTVISPLMLIYSSKDLRQAIKQKFNKSFM